MVTGGPSRSRRTRAGLDDADVRLVELLSQDGRMSNRALAGEIGLTEATVAARIRSLFDRRIVGVTATLDWQAAGYRWDAWFEVEVDVGDQSVRSVGEELARLEGVHAVHVVFGSVDLLVHVLLANSDEAVEFISERFKVVKGVRRLRLNVTLETRKYTTQFARLPVRPRALNFPSPALELDDLDRALIEAVVADGRQSNREIGRQLEVSEGTVRVRLRRLESIGLLRIAGQSDPFLTGVVRAWAFVGVELTSGAARSVSEKLCALPEVTIVALTAGRYDILSFVTGRSRSRLVDLVDELRTMPGVRATETWDVVHTLGLNYHWARLL